MTIGTLVATLAAARRDKIAIVAAGRAPLDYAGLARQVEMVGESLRSMGIGAPDRVALVLPNGPDLAVAFAGVAAHSVCAPLNPASSSRELEFLLGDLAPRAVIVEPGTVAASLARSLGIPLIELRPTPDAAAGVFTLHGDACPIRAMSDASRPDDVALLLHTSGTTARPKLVALTHFNLCHSARNVSGHLELGPADRCLVVMPLFHIHGLVAGLLASLAAGGSVVCTRGCDAAAMMRWIEDLRPTWITAVPTMYQALVAAATSADTTRATGSSLRFLRSASAPLPRRLMEDLERMFDVPVIEAYGMTEAAHQIASNPLPPAHRRAGTVGRAAGPEVAIMGPAGDLLAAGEPGEVVIRGENVTSGYVGNPAASDASRTDGWFRTGDRGVLDDDGYLTLLGRLKEIIIRGGEKISPREIDDVLMEHPAVAEAVTFAVPHATLGEDVAAAVVLRNGCHAAPSDLRGFVAARLAPFKVPRRVVLVDELPKGPTGKHTRVGLASRLGVGAEGGPVVMSGAATAASRSPVEEALSDIWRGVLKLPRVDVDDDFFLSGGDSLRAAELVLVVAEVFGVELPDEALLGEAGTVAGMARVIAGLRQQGTDQKVDEAVSGGDVRTFQAGGSGAVLFAVEASPLLMRQLLPLVGPDQPVLGLSMAPLERHPSSMRSIADVARHHLDTMRRVRPGQPYIVCGHSFAGLVAYEIGCQAHAGGEDVRLVAMLDTVAPRVHYQPVSAPLHAHLRRALALGPRASSRHIRSFLRKRALFEWHRLRSRLGPAAIAVRSTTLPPPSQGLDRRALTYRYVPAPFAGNAALFTTATSVDICNDPYLGWSPIAGRRFDVYRVPGTHWSMVHEPADLRALAEALAGCVCRVRDGVGAPA